MHAHPWADGCLNLSFLSCLFLPGNCQETITDALSAASLLDPLWETLLANGPRGGAEVALAGAHPFWVAPAVCRAGWGPPAASPMWGSPPGTRRSPGAGGHLVGGLRSAASLGILISSWWLSPPWGEGREGTGL